VFGRANAIDNASSDQAAIGDDEGAMDVKAAGDFGKLADDVGGEPDGFLSE
jgi:hypothetical protein